MKPLKSLLFAPSILLPLAIADPAHADVVVAGQVGANVVVSNFQDNTIQTAGIATALRVGYELEGPLLRLTPEGKIGFESPGTPDALTIMGGARLNLFDPISPAVFAHAGGLVGDIEGFAWDAGLGLDFTLLPILDLGIYGSFHQAGSATLNFGNVALNRNSWEWLQFGAQASLRF